ncbi:MAG: TrkA family potassium uptake protein [Candidatus Eremiobacteraeota bacterium]|nr:TrkA family potassium uptake protein [Candidatus Eremiobacteraeota bacterium]
MVLFGTAGYVAIERWPWFDAFYVTITTITTIGGGEPTPMSVAAKLWTVAVVAVGFGVFTYTLLRLFTYALEGRLGNVVLERRTRLRVAKMTEHYILCGFGRVGSEIAHLFTKEGVPFVIVDINPDSLDRAAAQGFNTVSGDAADAETLKSAGVERARGLLAAMDGDEANIYVTLSARVLNPNLFIIARANRRDAESKLRLAGASRIISPYQIGGRRMASLATRPTAVEFVDTVLLANNSELILEDFVITPGSPWIGRPLSVLTRNESDVIILALKRAGEMHFRPSLETAFAERDEIVAAGPPEGIRELDQRLRRAE